ncbi:MAG: 30S ribosomal protein S5 [Planctomycetota bacterium]|nr:30S ribosomal protein S5 [Planctomycetota bacterium]
MGRQGRQGRQDGRGQDRDEVVVKINRCATVVKGGRRFSFSALVVVGDKKGKVGFGFGKANDVPGAVDKGTKDARRSQKPVVLEGKTIPHQVMGKFGAARVLLLPAPKGTGVLAGAAVRAVVESAGIRDILTKSYGTSNPVNLVKATMQGLISLRSREEVERLRGVKLGAS